MKAVLFAVAASLTLASCTTSNTQANAALAFDRVCYAEPPLYAAFVAIAEARKVPAKTLQRAEAIHGSITTICANRPTDVVSALVTVSAAYAQFVTIAAKYK